MTYLFSHAQLYKRPSCTIHHYHVYLITIHLSSHRICVSPWIRHWSDHVYNIASQCSPWYQLRYCRLYPSLNTFSVHAWRFIELSRLSHTITFCAVTQSRVLRTSWVPYANMETSTPRSSETSQDITMNIARLITSVRRTHLPSLVRIRPLGVASRIREIYTSCDFSTFLPFFLHLSQAKRIEIISRTMAPKTQFGVKKCLKCLASVFLIWRFGGHFAPKPQNFAPIGKSQPNKKNLITSKPFKIDKSVIKNINIKLGSFQNPYSEITWSAP